jgi:tetratricopeptide (TPR) repeat protein
MGFLFYGCAAFQGAPDKAAIPLYKQYSAKAVALEKKNELGIALYYCKIANILAPDDIGTVFCMAGLKTKIAQESEQHYRKGIDLYSNNFPEQAFNEFLTVCRYDPDHKGAGRHLRAIQSGKKYAEVGGDSIAETSVVPPATVEEPQKGVSISVRKGVDDKNSFSAKPSQATQKIINNGRANLLKAKTCFNNKKYSQKIVTASKVLKDEPENREALELRNALYFKQGNALEAQRKYYEALKKFRCVEPGYKNVDNKILTLEKILKKRADFFYKKGVKLFVEERLQDAIVQWNKAMQFNPEHKEAQKSIQKACNILEKLKKVK